MKLDEPSLSQTPFMDLHFRVPFTVVAGAAVVTSELSQSIYVSFASKSEVASGTDVVDAEMSLQ